MESTEDSSTSSQQQQPNLPPGFRFHPTDEELVVHYLKKKVDSVPLPVSIIADVDLYKFDPWELPGMSPISPIQIIDCNKVLNFNLQPLL